MKNDGVFKKTILETSLDKAMKKEVFSDAQMSKDPINFAGASPDDWEIAKRCVERAVLLGREHGFKLDSHILLMDCMAVHCNGQPINFLQLLMSDNADFTHDILGFGMHVDRSTGKLMNDFTPIFGVKIS